MKTRTTNNVLSYDTYNTTQTTPSLDPFQFETYFK